MFFKVMLAFIPENNVVYLPPTFSTVHKKMQGELTFIPFSQ